MTAKYPPVRNGLSYGNDDTLSSKTSEYDNVPMLPDYYYHYQKINMAAINNRNKEHDNPEYDTPTSLDSERPPPVPPHLGELPGGLQTSNLYSPVKHLQQYPFVHDQDSENACGEDPRGGSPSECKETLIERQKSPVPLSNSPVQNKSNLEIRKSPVRNSKSPENPEDESRIRKDSEQEGESQAELIPREEKTMDKGKENSMNSDKRRLHSELYREMSRGAAFLFYLLIFLTEILLFGVLILCLIWVQFYRNGFGWREEPDKQFNLHPVLMITGFIFCSGHSILVYRLFRCCNKLMAKLVHTLFHLLAVPCIAVAAIAVFEYHNEKSIPHLYSLHSWLGVTTLGLFALQLAFGFFSFWFLLCCEKGTSSFRTALVPVHSTFGIITFMLAIATCVTGFTEKAFFVLTKDRIGDEYSSFVDEAYVVNAQGIALAGLAILMGYLLYPTKDSETHEFQYPLLSTEAILVNVQAVGLAGLGILLTVMVSLKCFRRSWTELLMEHL